MIKSIRFDQRDLILESSDLQPDITLDNTFWTMYYPVWTNIVLLARLECEKYYI